MKKILIVTFTMETGGLEKVVMDIIKNIDKKKYVIEILVNPVLEESHNIKLLKDMGIKVHYIQTPGTLGPISYVRNLRKTLNENGPFDVVHSHNEYHGGLVSFASYLEKVPVRIVHSHTTSTSTWFNRLLLPIYKVMICMFSTKKLAVSKAAGRHLFYGKYDVIMNGQDIDELQDINLDSVKSIRSKFMKTKKTIILGHVGRLSPEKNQKFLLTISKILKEKNIDFVLLIIGEGEERKNLEIEIKESELQDYVYLLGSKTNVHNYMYSFDCLIQPSLYEGLPLVSFECQAVGTPLIVSEAFPQEADLGIGLFHQLPLHDASLWCDKIISITQNKCDSKIKHFNEYKQSMISQKYDINTMIDRLVEYYEGK